MATIEIPKEYGYVLLAAAGSYIIGHWHAMRIGSFRRAAGVAYPQHYVSEEAMAAATPDQKQKLYLYNCAQRAHGNFLENYPFALSGMLLGGLKYPIASAATGLAWMVFRILYAVGYTRKDKQGGRGRLIGSGFWWCQLGFMGLVAKTAYDVLMK